MERGWNWVRLDRSPVARTFYPELCVVLSDSAMLDAQVKTTPIEAKDSYFANVKSNNYLQNALVVMDAESEQLHQVKCFALP